LGVRGGSGDETPGEEVGDQPGDLGAVGGRREVAGVEQVQLGVRQVE
jgi:hypothetical protein